MFTIVRIKGKQYKVQEGDVITVPHIEGEVGSLVKLPDILLVGEENKTKIGTPLVPGVSVAAKIVEQGKGGKIDITRYKAKVRYRRHQGFRPLYTKLEIVSIGRA